MAFTDNPFIAILPTPGMGHLIPLVEFAKTIFRRFGFCSTFFIPTDGPLSKAQKLFLDSLPPSLDYILLPPVNFDDMPPDIKIETRISLNVTRSMSSLREAVKSAHEIKRFSAFVVDLFGTDGFEVSMELNIPQYIFFPSTAMLLSLIFCVPEFHEKLSCEFWEVKEKFHIMGCVPINGRELLMPLQDKKDDCYKWVLHHARRYDMAEGILVNTFIDMEPKTIKALQEMGSEKPKIYPIGPLITAGTKSDDDDSKKCINWLNDQPAKSVVFISFGSGGTLSSEQLVEVAMGLEASKQRFLWVVRCPSDAASNTYFFNIPDSSDPLAYLPEGFIDRTKDRGFLVPLWAPQAQILAHDSVGAFLSHCGWNSTLESIVNGVPLISWPLFAEQRMNAVMLTEDVKVALRPKVGENGVVDRIEISNVLNSLMEGEEGKAIRNRVTELRAATSAVLGHNGSSTKSLEEVVEKWKSVFTCANKING